MVLEALASEAAPYDVDVLAGAQQLATEPLPVPALRDLGPGRADAQKHAPSRQLIDRGGRHRRHRRGAAGHLEDRRSELDRACLPGKPGKHGRRVRPVRLRRPDRVVAERLGLLGDPKLIPGGHARRHVAEVHAELHLQVSVRPKELV